MKVYLLSPYYRTGGPENIHLLCHTINTHTNHQAYIFYTTPANPSPLYDYPNIQIATIIEDHPDNMLLLPEVHTLPKNLSHIKIIIWWLSYTNAALHQTLENMKHPYHFFQSYYAFAQVQPHLHPSAYYAFLSDHLHPDFLSILDPFDKTNLIAYNPSKDALTPLICNKLNLLTLPLTNMNRSTLIQNLKKCKIYIDLGFHPGKDRLPREAALCGCVVITNKSGAAAYHEDLPIQEKIIHPEDLLTLLPIVLANYDAFYAKQEPYRTHIKNEKEAFLNQVKQIWKPC